MLDSPSYPTAPEGGEAKGYGYFPGYSRITADEEVTTNQIDFYSPNVLEPSVLASHLEGIGADLANLVGQELVMYVLFEAPPQEVTVPSEIVIGDIHWTPPFGGNTIMSLRSYRLWFLTRDLAPAASAWAVRPQVTFWGAIGVGLAASVILGVFGVIWFIMTGKLPANELSRIIHDYSPGSFAESTSWPLFAFGFALAVGAVLLPKMSEMAGGSLSYGTRTGTEARVGVGRR